MSRRRRKVATLAPGLELDEVVAVLDLFATRFEGAQLQGEGEVWAFGLKRLDVIPAERMPLELVAPQTAAAYRHALDVPCSGCGARDGEPHDSSCPRMEERPGVRCPSCRGTATVPDDAGGERPCSTCNGSGAVG